MRACRTEIARLAAVALLLSVPARAQSTAPVPLLPDNATPAPAAGDDNAAPAPDQDIQSTPLTPADPSWIGTLGPADSALPRTMWTGTPRGVVSAALPLLQPTTSPALQDLARRLLLSDAIAPPGADHPGAPGLPELRLDRLLALGRIDATPLIDALPDAVRSETFDRDSVELKIAAADVAGACRLVQDRVGHYRNAWWDRALIACQALNGVFDQAALGLSAMREQKTARDPVFEALIDTIDGHRQKLDKLPDPTPLRMALLAAAHLPLPPDALAAATPAALAVWATSDKVPALQRLAAAERAEQLGSLPPAALGLVYASIDVKPGEQDAAVAGGKLPDDARGRALLYDFARSNAAPDARVGALAPLLADARRRGALVAFARLVAPLVVELKPEPAYQAFAGDAARVLLASGHIDEASDWVALAHTPELLMIDELARSGDGAREAPLLQNAMAALAARDPAAAPRQADLLLALGAALGVPRGDVPLAPLLQLPHPGMLPGAALWLDQILSTAAGRFGETVLTSVLMATAGDKLSPEPVVLARVVAGLKAIGLEADARAIAVEAALDAGI